MTDEQKAAVNRLKTKWICTSISCPGGKPAFEWVKDLAVVADMWLAEHGEQAVDIFDEAIRETKDMAKNERAGERIDSDFLDFRMSNVFTNLVMLKKQGANNG